MLRAPLSGVRVLDLSRLLPGPLCTRLLADFGASVDKLEDPAGGDYLRYAPPLVGGRSAFFEVLNRGKRAVSLSLKDPAARAAFVRLVSRYDVLCESFRPDVWARLSLDTGALCAENPRLIVCSITGYGQSGPMAERAGHDLNYLAQAGVLGLTGPAKGPPQVFGVQLADIGGGALYGALAVTLALFDRERTGRGAHLDVAMTDASALFATLGLTRQAADASGAPPRGGDQLTGGIAPYSAYETEDGRYVTLAALEPKFWTAFCAAVGIEADLGALLPGAHQAEWFARLSELFRSRTRDAWTALFLDKDCCVEPVLSPAETLASEYLRARGVLCDVLGLPQVRLPIASREAPDGPAPALGEHTRAILAEAGLDEATVASLLDRGVAKA